MSKLSKSRSDEGKRAKYMSPGPAGRSRENLSPIRSTEFWDKLRSEPSIRNGRQRKSVFDGRRKRETGNNWRRFHSPTRNNYKTKNEEKRISRSRSRSNPRNASSRYPSPKSEWIPDNNCRGNSHVSANNNQDEMFYQTIEKITSCYKSPQLSTKSTLPMFDPHFQSMGDVPYFESSFTNADLNYSRLEKENAALEYLVSIGRDRLQEKQSSRDDRSFHRFDDSSRYESWKNLSRKYSSNKSPERRKRKRSISSKRSTSSSRRRKSRSSSPRKSSHHSRSHRRTKSRTRSRSKSRHRSRSSRRSQGDSRKATPPSDRLNSTLFEISPEPLKRSFDSETFLEHSQEQLSPFLNERVRKLEEYFEGKNPNLTEKELVDLKFPLFESGIENQKFERSVASYSSSITENNNFKVNDGNFGNQEFEGTGKLCKYYLCGYCKLGARCTFSHKCQPLVKKKVELCLYYAGDGCSKGELCQRLHKQFPCKDFHKTRSCTLGPKRCKFSHDSLNTELENALNRFILFNPPVKRKTTNDQPYRNTPLSQKHVDLDMPKNDATNFVNSAFCNQSPQFSSFHAGNDPRPKYANQFSAPSEAYQKSYVVDSQFSEGPPNFSLGVRQQHPNDSCQSLQSGTSPSSIEVPWNTTRSKSYEPTIFSANDDNANGVEWYDPLRFPLPANDREKVTPQWKTEPEAKFSPPMEVSTVKNEVLPTSRFEELSGQMFPVKRSPEFFTPTTQCSGVGSHQNSSSSSSYRCVAIPFEKQCSLKDPRIENFNNDSSIYRGLLTCKVSLPSLPGIQTCATEISCNYIIPWRTLRPLTLQPIESVSDSYSTERLMSKQTLSLSGAGLVEKPEIKLEIQKEIQSLCQLNFKQVAPKEEPEDPEQRRISGSLSIKELFCMADPTASPFV